MSPQTARSGTHNNVTSALLSRGALKRERAGLVIRETIWSGEREQRPGAARGLSGSSIAWKIVARQLRISSSCSGVTAPTAITVPVRIWLGRQRPAVLADRVGLLGDGGGRDDGVGDGERGVEHVADDESDRGASDPDPWLGHPWEGCREREDAL